MIYKCGRALFFKFCIEIIICHRLIVDIFLSRVILYFVKKTRPIQIEDKFSYLPNLIVFCEYKLDVLIFEQIKNAQLFQPTTSLSC